MRIILLILTLNLTLNSLHAQDTSALMRDIRNEFSMQRGVFAFVFIDVKTGRRLVLNEKETFHAASTMKTPVMIEVFRQVKEGKLSLSDSVLLKNEFTSIVDGSPFSLNASDDSDPGLYGKIGTRVALRQLVYEMIIMSSNLATNTVMEMVKGTNVTRTMRGLGAMDIQVLRGVEDQKAFDRQLNNTTTANDLALLFLKMARGEIVDSYSCDEMIKILLDQTHNTMIPALLPPGVKVAHKTGTITGVHHDSGIVFLPDGRKYVLVMLSKQVADPETATAAMARVSRRIYEDFIAQ